MRIAQVAPLIESVPPKGYGGTERVVSYLTEQLVEMGHEVSLFASADSVTTARLMPCCPRSLRSDPECVDNIPRHLVMLENVYHPRHRFDVIHFHVDYLHFPFTRRMGARTVTTLHGRLDIPDLVPLYREYAEMPVVSISDAQRRPLPGANWLQTVYHGLPRDLYPFTQEPGDYLAVLGRTSPEKGIDKAIQIAGRAGMPLRIAAKVDPVEKGYFERVIRPLLARPGVEFLGEIGEEEKKTFLGNARALLLPIEWPEPFGLVMIEAMACGTPVIAFDAGSVPEILEDGVTGFIVGGVDAAVEAVGMLGSLSRPRCREEFERRFTAERMASEYVSVYQQLRMAQCRRFA